MHIFVFLILSAAFLSAFSNTRDGLLWEGALLILCYGLLSVFPDTMLASLLQLFLPF